MVDADDAPPDDTIAMLAWLAGRTVAHDLLLRGLYAGAAMQQPDPQAYIFEKIEGLIGSLDLVDMSPEIREQAEQHLRDFAENLATRCHALAARERKGPAASSDGH